MKARVYNLPGMNTRSYTMHSSGYWKFLRRCICDKACFLQKR